jgi:hypothetical protein
MTSADTNSMSRRSAACTRYATWCRKTSFAMANGGLAQVRSLSHRCSKARSSSGHPPVHLRQAQAGATQGFSEESEEQHHLVRLLPGASGEGVGGLRLHRCHTEEQERGWSHARGGTRPVSHWKARVHYSPPHNRLCRHRVGVGVILLVCIEVFIIHDNDVVNPLRLSPHLCRGCP